MKILTSDQMKNIDRRATEQFGVPSLLLMEDAAQAVLAATIERFHPEVIAIFCGPGQNGGDGYAMARLAASAGITPLVFALTGRDHLKGDAAINYDLCRRSGIPLWVIGSEEDLEGALARATSADVVIDAIFGSGLTRPPADLFAEAIRQLPLLRLPIVAVDVPSGIDASVNLVAEPVVRADITITFCALKMAHVFQPAASCCGEVLVAPISIPPAAIDAEGVTISLATADEVAPLVAPRSPDSHKGTFGHIGIVAGSPGRSGAAVLAARGALRAGGGLVTVLTDSATAAVVHNHSVESMTRTLPDPWDPGALAAILENFDAAVIGPGLADDEASYARIRELLKQLKKRVLVDASALNAFAGRISELRPTTGERILTPHPGELGRLLGMSAEAVNSDRISNARRAARESGCIVVLKGQQTVVASPDGIVSINPTGNAGMAAGGMGDVLSGIAGTLLAQADDAFDAARGSVYLHGLAGNLLQQKRSDIGMTAMDLADELPWAVRSIREHE